MLGHVPEHAQHTVEQLLYRFCLGSLSRCSYSLENIGYQIVSLVTRISDVLNLKKHYYQQVEVV
jgi:hypothetical protein